LVTAEIAAIRADPPIDPPPGPVEAAAPLLETDDSLD
jgi:hypothetical protein